MFKRTSITRREWGYFGLRWVFPVGMIVFAFLGTEPQNGQLLVPIVLVTVVAILSNLLVALLLVTEYWASYVTIIGLVVDVGLMLGSVYVTDIRLAWLGLLPIAVVGIYFDWIASLIVAAVAVIGVIVMQLFVVEQSTLNAGNLVMLLAAFPAIGPLASMLARQETSVQIPSRVKPVQQKPRATRTNQYATEYMAVVYEMAEVLSASKLDPGRVLSSAVNFGLEGLERVGASPPLFGIILLFAGSDEDMGTVLRVARSSNSVTPSDNHVVVPGISGAIEKALTSTKPSLASSLENDSELCQFDSLRTCNQPYVCH